MYASVSAAAERPFGPAAIDASAPSFTLVRSRLPAPRSFITRKTKSVASPPICKPTLPPSSAYMAGEPHGPVKSLPVRHTMVCRTGKDFTGPWGSPAMYALEGGSVGLQIGGEATDFVFLVMNDRGA